jgi:hypothetical protein
MNASIREWLVPRLRRIFEEEAFDDPSYNGELEGATSAKPAIASSKLETMMTSRDDVELMILSDLAALCKKLAHNPIVPERVRAEALGFVENYNSLRPYEGTGSRPIHFDTEGLVIQITRFLPNVTQALDAESVPE